MQRRPVIIAILPIRIILTVLTGLAILTVLSIRIRRSARAPQ
jgi:hypothetical protein